MAKRFITTGMNLIDETHYEGSDDVQVRIGGSVIYGLNGMLYWTDDVAYTGRGGNDFTSTYGTYLSRNGISPNMVRILDEPTNRIAMRYHADGTSIRAGTYDRDARAALEKKWRPDLRDIESYVGGETEGLYISSPPEGLCDFWNGFFTFKAEHGFKVMWEPNPPCTFPENKKATQELCAKIEMASFNLSEGGRIFGTSSEEELIGVLQGLGPELVVLRVGSRGLYTITKDAVCFVPSAPLPVGQRVVDVTGCGNASTAATMVGWCMTHDPAKTGVMANISASYVLRQYGPADVTAADRKEASAQEEELLKKHRYNYL